MGAISGKKAYFQETSKLYEEALSIYTIERIPEKWAEVFNNYGMVLLALGEQAGTDAPWTVRSKISERLWVCADGNPFPCCGPKPSKTKVRPVLPWPKEIQTQPYCANGLTALEGRLRCIQSLARQKNQPLLKTIYRKLSGYCRLLIRAKKPPTKVAGFFVSSVQ